MRRILTALILMASMAQAQTMDWLESTDNIGTSRIDLNENFSNLLSFTQGGYSNRIDLVGVTNQPAGTAYIVTNGTDRWMLIGTNDGGGSASSTPQSPWTNWVEASSYGVSNAGTYNVASSNVILMTLGTNKLTIQGTASEPTNVAWNGNSLWSPAGSSIGPYVSPASNNTYTAGTTQTMDVAEFTGGFILGGVLVTNVSTNAGNSAYTNTFTGQGTTGAVTSTSSDTGKFLNAVGQMVTPGYPAGVGGGTNGLVLIASYVADDTTNRVEFSAIPQTYKALLLIGGLWERGEATWDSGSVNGAPIVLRVNNNTNAVYDWSRTFITGNARTDGTLNNYPYIYASYGTSTTNGWCSFRTRFNNYTLAGVAKAIDSEWTVAAYASPPTMTYLAGEFRGGVREMNAMTNLVVYAISTTNWSRGRLDLYGVQ